MSEQVFVERAVQRLGRGGESMACTLHVGVVPTLSDWPEERAAGWPQRMAQVRTVEGQLTAVDVATRPGPVGLACGGRVEPGTWEVWGEPDHASQGSGVHVAVDFDDVPSVEQVLRFREGLRELTTMSRLADVAVLTDRQDWSVPGLLFEASAADPSHMLVHRAGPIVARGAAPGRGGQQASTAVLRSRVRRLCERSVRATIDEVSEATRAMASVARRYPQARSIVVCPSDQGAWMCFEEVRDEFGKGVAISEDEDSFLSDMATHLYEERVAEIPGVVMEDLGARAQRLGDSIRIRLVDVPADDDDLRAALSGGGHRG